MVEAPKRTTQKIDHEPCDQCGSNVWSCRRIVRSTEYPWTKRTEGLSAWQRYSWPWVGGILLSCATCKRTWFANASMTRFNEVRDLLPVDGTAALVRLPLAQKTVLVAVPARRFARPKRRAS